MTHRVDYGTNVLTALTSYGQWLHIESSSHTYVVIFSIRTGFGGFNQFRNDLSVFKQVLTPFSSIRLLSIWFFGSYLSTFST